MTASTVNTLALHVAEHGRGDPVVVLHGLYGAGNNWRRHATSLAAHYRVLLPDLRNHGRSPHAPEMTYEAMAGDLERLLDERDLEAATFLGHSMGGKAAMAMALTRPERVSALIVADIAPIRYRHDHDSIIAAMQSVDLDSLGSRQDAERALEGAVAEASVRQFLLTNLERRDGAWRWRLPLEILREALPGILDFPAYRARYGGPALFVHGEHSDYVDDEARVAVREYFPEAAIVALRGAGHFLHVEQPHAFADTVERFLSAARTTGIQT